MATPAARVGPPMPPLRWDFLFSPSPPCRFSLPHFGAVRTPGPCDADRLFQNRRASVYFEYARRVRIIRCDIVGCPPLLLFAITRYEMPENPASPTLESETCISLGTKLPPSGPLACAIVIFVARDAFGGTAFFRLDARSCEKACNKTGI